MRALVLAAALGASLLVGPAIAQQSQETPPLPKQAWPFEGVFGAYDRAAAQR